MTKITTKNPIVADGGAKPHRVMKSAAFAAFFGALVVSPELLFNVGTPIPLAFTIR
ncbi:MAG: hypothetical protein ABID61_01340 [Candidatus Micrarchaeota archaeon]